MDREYDYEYAHIELHPKVGDIVIVVNDNSAPRKRVVENVFVDDCGHMYAVCAMLDYSGKVIDKYNSIRYEPNDLELMLRPKVQLSMFPEV